MASFSLTSTEQGVVPRGRNANLTAREKVNNKSLVDISVYQDPIICMALFDYHYISDKHQFNEIISWIQV